MRAGRIAVRRRSHGVSANERSSREARCRDSRRFAASAFHSVSSDGQRLIKRRFADEPSRSVPIDEITESLVRRIRADAAFAELVAHQLRGRTPTFARSIDELIDNDEDDAVEFKSTARWDLREQRRNPALEDAIVKTVAAFLNCEGGTLLIGVGPDRSLVGLATDYAHVRPQNGDGFVNWLTTHLSNALGTAAVTRTRARIVVHRGFDLCRLDVPKSSRPIWANTSKGDRVFFVRLNNSSRPMPEAELGAYLGDRWPDIPPMMRGRSEVT